MADEHAETQPSPDQKVDPEIPTNLPLGAYVNFMRVTNTRDEFVFEFGASVHGTKYVALHTKLISSPTHTKRMLRALQENIAKYEREYGPIPQPETRAAERRAE